MIFMILKTQNIKNYSYYIHTNSDNKYDTLYKNMYNYYII